MNNIYQDIAQRTNGDIYIGVVGPVRTGKSTFVSKFMEQLILPNIKDRHTRKRATDELPQGADGKTIMTTQPKFVPGEAVSITFSDKSQAKVRLIDCVGYLVEGAEGHTEDDKPRLVTTPWSGQPMPFEQAAELGTQKVVTEHSTVAVVVTNDGTVTELPRANYVAAEERVIRELKALGKPFVVVLNTRNEKAKETVALAKSLTEKYDVTVIAMDVVNADSSSMEKVITAVLGEFPVRKMSVDMDDWMRVLPKDHWLIKGVIDKVRESCTKISRMKDSQTMLEGFGETDWLCAPKLVNMDMGRGEVNYSIEPKADLYFKILSEMAETDISDRFALMKFVSESAFAKAQYDSLRSALEQAEQTGYGVVCPSPKAMQLEQPEIVKQGTKYGVRLKATAPSLHIMKIDVATEVSPMVGTEQQSQYLLSEFQQNPEGLWQTNMFGKSLSSLVQEGLTEKCVKMPHEMQEKLVRTVGKIVNDGKGGLICLLL